MEQPDKHLYVKVNDKRQYARLMTWLQAQGFYFGEFFAGHRVGVADGMSVWEQETTAGKTIRALVVCEDTDVLKLITKDEFEDGGPAQGWDLMSIDDFKEAVEKLVARRPLRELATTYKLRKDSVELNAGAVVALCETPGHEHYYVVTPELRRNPKADDAVFPATSQIKFSRPNVEDQPDWWERVYELCAYVSDEQYLNITKQLKNGK